MAICLISTFSVLKIHLSRQLDPGSVIVSLEDTDLRKKKLPAFSRVTEIETN